MTVNKFTRAYTVCFSGLLDMHRFEALGLGKYRGESLPAVFNMADQWWQMDGWCLLTYTRLPTHYLPLTYYLLVGETHSSTGD